jgi:4-hydroxybenzoate polyprenyltransferase
MLSSISAFNKKFAQHFVYSNVFISLCCVAQGLLTYKLLDIPVDFNVITLLFSCTFIVYNFYFLISGETGEAYFQSDNRKKWVENHKIFLYILISLFALIGLWTLSSISWDGILFLIFLGGLGVLYSLPNKNGLKSIPSLKSIILILIWTGAVVIFPLIELNKSLLENSSLILFFKRLVFIACLTIPFDIRDYDSDKKNNINTIPVVIGIRNTKIICYVLLILYFILLYIFDSGKQITLIYGLGLANFMLAFFIYQSNQKKEDLFFWVKLDGIMILQFLFVYFFSIFKN